MPTEPKLALLQLVPADRRESNEATLVEGLRRNDPEARTLLFERYVDLVERTLRRILGREVHADLADLIQECFLEALGSLSRLRDPAALPGWLRTIAVHIACKTIRSRRARAWLLFWDRDELPEVEVPGVDPEHADAYRRTYMLLERLGADERAAFVLRYIEGLELRETAEACRVSLATIKRRLASAERRFLAGAMRDPVLREWVEGGSRWSR